MVALRWTGSRHRLFHGKSGNGHHHHRHPCGVADIQDWLVVPVAFGAEVKNTKSPTGCIRIPLNILWIVFGGLWAWLMHIFFGVLLFITIIGIPFAKQHFKMAGLSLAPFGKDVELHI